MADIGKLAVVLTAQGAPMVADAKKAAKDATGVMNRELSRIRPVPVLKPAPMPKLLKLAPFEESRLTSMTSSLGAMVNPLALVTTAVLALGAAIVGLVTGAIRAAFAMDELADTAERIGVDVGALTSLGYAAEIAGTDMATLTGSLQIFTRNLGQAMNGSQEMSAAFARVGLDARTLANMPIDEAMLEVADALQTMGTQAERTAFLTRAFGRQGAALGPLLMRGRAGIQELTNRAQQLGITFDQDTGAAVGEFTDRMGDLGRISTGVLQQLAAAIARDLGPAIRELIPLAAMVGRGLVVSLRLAMPVIKGTAIAALLAFEAIQNLMAHLLDRLVSLVRLVTLPLLPLQLVNEPVIARQISMFIGGLTNISNAMRGTVTMSQQLRRALTDTFTVEGANWASGILDPLRGVQSQMEQWLSGTQSDAERLAGVLMGQQRDIAPRNTPALERGSAAAIEATSQFNAQIDPAQRTQEEILETARAQLEEERIQREQQQEMIDLLAAAFRSGQLQPPPAPI